MNIGELVEISKKIALFDRSRIKQIAEDPMGMEKGVVTIILIGVVVGIGSSIRMLLAWEQVNESIELLRRFIDVSNSSYAGYTFSEFFQGTVDFLIALSRPTPLRVIAEIISSPFSLVLSWFIWGSLVYLVASAFGGKVSYRNAMAAFAFSVVPNVLNLFNIIPSVGLIGTLSWLWGTVLFFVILKTIYGFSDLKAMIATLLPGIVVVLAFVWSLLTVILLIIKQLVWIVVVSVLLFAIPVILFIWGRKLDIAREAPPAETPPPPPMQS